MESLRIIPKVWTDIERRRHLQDLFAARYSEFLRWALQITRFDKSVAEEIVHDAYVNFARTLPDLQNVQNLDGYIYDSFRNLNTSRKKRAWKHSHESLDILEFDSLRSRLRIRRGADSLELQDQLELLCKYLCWRKQSVRSASLLLFRFFRNYYPDEIAGVARLSRKAVNVQIGRARNEARSYIENAAKWDAIADFNVKVPLSKSRRTEGGDALVRQFSDMIRLNRSGECFSNEQLERFYGAGSTHAPGTEQLAHLVSCDECLRRVGGLLSDGSSDDPSIKSHGDVGKVAQRAIEFAEETIRELLDHDPSVLVLAVNGEDVLEYSVTPLALEQLVAISPSTDLRFVEVFDRVGQRLLKIDVNTTPPDGPAEVHGEALLAGDRTLRVVVQWYGSDPSIRLEYAAASGEQRSEATLLELVPRIPVMTAMGTSDLNSELKQRWPVYAWAVLRRWLGWRQMFPILAFIAALIAWKYYSRLNESPRVALNPSAILAASQRSESVTGAGPNVSHRTIAFEERIGDSPIVRTGRVEVWRGGDRVATRFYDGQGKFVAGEWRHGSSTESVVKDGRLQRQEGEESCLTEASAWSCDLSASTFAKLGDSGDTWKVGRLQAEYVIHLERAIVTSADSSAPRLVRADLLIDKKTMRSRRENLWVESGGEVHEYKLTEVDYEPVTSLRSDDPVLRPDANLRPRPRDHSELTHRPVDPLIQSALAHLQLQVLSRLHAVNADVGKPLTVERTNDGRVSIRGVLTSDQDAKVIRAALADLAGDPRMNQRVYSVNELQTSKRHKAERPTVIEQYEVNAEQCPAESLLRAHFQSLGYRNSQLEVEIHRYIQQVLGQSAKALQEAWTLHQFTESFDARAVVSLSVDDQRIWATLLSQHSQALAGSLESLRRSVEWMPQVDAALPSPPVVPEKVLPLTTTVEGVLMQTTEINHSLRSMFMVSADGDDPPKPPDFHQLLSAAQNDLLKVQAASRRYSASLRLSDQ